MKKGNSLFTLEADRWYAYEMLPGYAGRYYSPIKIYHVQPLKTGRDILRVRFHNACYAEGVQGFHLELKVLHRGESYMLARIENGSSTEDRGVVICQLTWEWLRTHFGQQVLQRAEELGVRKGAPIEDVVDKVFR